MSQIHRVIFKTYDGVVIYDTRREVYDIKNRRGKTRVFGWEFEVVLHDDKIWYGYPRRILDE